MVHINDGILLFGGLTVKYKKIKKNLKFLFYKLIFYNILVYFYFYSKIGEKRTNKRIIHILLYRKQMGKNRLGGVIPSAKRIFLPYYRRE